MKIRYIRPQYKGVTFRVGHTEEVDDATGWKWIRRGVAVDASEPIEKGTDAPVETSSEAEAATFGEPETMTSGPSRPTRRHRG